MIALPRGSWQRINAMLWRQVRQTLQWIGPHAINVVRPAGYLLLAVGIGATFGSAEYHGRTISYIDFMLPGLLTMIAFEAFNDALVRSANDKQWGVFRIAILHGVRPGEYIAAHVLYGFTWFAFRSLILLAVAVLFGARPSWTALPITYLWSALGITTWAALGTAVGTRVDSYNVRDTLVSLLSVPLVFTSSAFYDTARVPLALKVVAKINPLSVLADTTRMALFGGETPFMAGISLVILAGCAFALAYIMVRRTPLVARDR